MKVLVTGHRGYLGSTLSARLNRDGHETIGLDQRKPAAECALIAGEAVETIPGELGDFLASDVSLEMLSGFDAVIHLAAAEPDCSSSTMFDMDLSNTLKLALRACQAAVPRFIFASWANYRWSTEEELVCENSQIYAGTDHYRAKVRAELALCGLASSTFSPTIMRLPDVYGHNAGMHFRGFMNRLAATAYALGKIPINSDGSGRHALLHVDDAAKAFAAILTAPRDLIHREVFNIGRVRESLSLIEIGMALKAVLPGARIDASHLPKMDHCRHDIDFGRLSRHVPDALPTRHLRVGLGELIQNLDSMPIRRPRTQSRSYDRVPAIGPVPNMAG
ncbi:NAD-dependent epimerase/dehydratase family protein [Croceicoccus sediminis]|uniref:NAD-dependent epimerase/dehydratase family protein n=1 Tax=Croceicoccus sediminis TaxID=2571150 RepID=UPI0011844024|nr:NAD(P)-dependent oxidoreductase [Croceicoccus sediminis]